MSQDLEARVIELESIVSYQDQMLEDLNQIVIEQQRSVDDLQKKIEHFLAAFRQKQTQQILSLQEAQSMNVLTSIYEVEMEKVNDMQLRWELQEMAELYHKRLSSLRSEVRWWRKRYELLRTHFSNEHINF